MPPWSSRISTRGFLRFFSGLSRVLSRASLDILLKTGEGRGTSSSLAARKVDCILWAGGFLSPSPELTSLW
ncbi:hypothetical protein MASR2M79_18790 [Aminivibrio sp.]